MTSHTTLRGPFLRIASDLPYNPSYAFLEFTCPVKQDPPKVKNAKSPKIPQQKVLANKRIVCFGAEMQDEKSLPGLVAPIPWDRQQTCSVTPSRPRCPQPGGKGWVALLLRKCRK